MKNVCIYYDRLEYLTAIWYKLWPSGIVYGHLVYFSHFGIFGARKIWQPRLQEADLPACLRKPYLASLSKIYDRRNFSENGDGEGRTDFELGWGAGLPDGIFSNQKITIWVIFGGP
jgi:hypothetical protein